MDRSQSFASASTDSIAFLELAFAAAPPMFRLNLASEKQLVGSLCKRHAVTDKSAPTACKYTVSGTISPLFIRYFSPFPYGTGSLSVSEEYLALPDGAGTFTQDFSGLALLWIPPIFINVHIRGFHSLWLPFPENSA